jgi:hypothetical protein
MLAPPRRRLRAPPSTERRTFNDEGQIHTPRDCGFVLAKNDKSAQALRRQRRNKPQAMLRSLNAAAIVRE